MHPLTDASGSPASSVSSRASSRAMTVCSSDLRLSARLRADVPRSPSAKLSRKTSSRCVLQYSAQKSPLWPSNLPRSPTASPHREQRLARALLVAAPLIARVGALGASLGRQLAGGGRAELRTVLSEVLQVQSDAGVQIHAVFVLSLFVLTVRRRRESNAVRNAPGAAAVLDFGDFLVVHRGALR